jgi:hypothetical protein
LCSLIQSIKSTTCEAFKFSAQLGIAAYQPSNSSWSNQDVVPSALAQHALAATKLDQQSRIQIFQLFITAAARERPPLLCLDPTADNPQHNTLLSPATPAAAAAAKAWRCNAQCNITSSCYGTSGFCSNR